MHPHRSTTAAENALQNLRQTLADEPCGTLHLPGNCQPLPLLDLLHNAGSELALTLRERLDGLAGAETLARTPIIGVCGALNSGKSTLVASLLGKSGQSRVLIGMSQAEASQQFVFWLPESASQDKAFLRCFEERFQQHFGAAPRRLSEDASEARRQVNANQRPGGEMKHPLLAFDAALDTHRLGFLDCPDIQRESAAEGASLRLHALTHAVRFCSAFVIVTSQEQLGSDTIPKLLRSLVRHAPGLPLFLAVNKVTTEPDEALVDAKGYLNHWKLSHAVKDLYQAAYLEEARKRKAWPDFRNAAGKRLTTLPAQLAVSDLGRAYLRSSLEEMQQAVEEGIGLLQQQDNQATQEAARAAAHVRQFLAMHFLDEQHQLRMLFSAGLPEQLCEALERTAPGDIWLALQAKKPFDWLAQKVRKQTQGSPSQHPSDMLHGVKATDFVAHMQPLTRLHAGAKHERLVEVWKQSLQQLARHHAKDATLDQVELDSRMKQFWEEIPVLQRLALPLMLAGSLTAVLFISTIDFGTTTVLAASWQEILLSAGLSYATNTVAMQKVHNLLEEKYGLRQLANLHAALLDGLCLPREGKTALHRKGMKKPLALPKPDLPAMPGQVQLLEKPPLQFFGSTAKRVISQIKKLKDLLLKNTTA